MVQFETYYSQVCFIYYLTVGVCFRFLYVVGVDAKYTATIFVVVILSYIWFRQANEELSSEAPILMNELIIDAIISSTESVVFSYNHCFDA